VVRCCACLTELRVAFCSLGPLLDALPVVTRLHTLRCFDVLYGDRRHGDNYRKSNQIK
jgi:hypothetical protein